MPWNTSDLHEIRDRVHRDIKAMLSTGTIEVREEGDVLLARHEHYTNRIEVVPPGQAAPADPPSLGMLKVTTDVPAAVTDVLRGRFFPGAPEGMERAFGDFELEFAARANRLASFGALTIERQRVFVASRITLYRDEDAWDRLQLPLAGWSILSATDDALRGVVRLFERIPARQDASAWTIDDIRPLHHPMSGRCFCTMNEGGLTAEFGIGAGAMSAMFGHQTALFELDRGRPHPDAGGGLFSLLELPYGFPSSAAAQQACMRLNLLELDGANRSPHLGAWCFGRRETRVAYVTFAPNYLRVVPNLAFNLTAWAAERAEWAGLVVPIICQDLLELR